MTQPPTGHHIPVGDARRGASAMWEPTIDGRRRAPRRWRARHSGCWLAAATLLGATGLNLAYGRQASLTVTLVFAAFVASALASVRETAVTGLAAVALAVLLGWPNGGAGTSVHLLRVAAVACGAGMAVWVAIRRTSREAKLKAVTRVADVAQQTILRPLPTELEGFRLAARYVSASAEASVGGDFYEAVATPWGVRLVVGDVRGKGLDAVRLAAVFLGEFRSRASSEQNLGDLAAFIDAAGSRAADDSGEEFATAVLAELRYDSLVIVRCGHPPPLIVRDGVVTSTETPAMLPLTLGGGSIETTVLPLDPGTRILFYSDGAVEARDPQGGDFRLDHALERHSASGGGEQALDRILDDLVSHCGGHIDDDVVLVIAEIPAVRPPLSTEGQSGHASGLSVRRRLRPRCNQRAAAGAVPWGNRRILNG